MAADWIKMRSDLFTHPKVVRISSALKVDTLRTVGGLMSTWCLFDAHSIDGQMDGYSPEVLDAHLRWDGFSAAMIDVGWLIYEQVDGIETLSLPRFDTHNGQSAKRRAQDADRKTNVRKMSALEADKKRTREEKRREEENNISEQAAAAAKDGKGENSAASPPLASCPSDENQKPSAEAIADLLTLLEAARGKRWKTGTHGETLQSWSDAGVTMAIIRDAHGLAVMARNRDNDQSAVNAGFLKLFVDEVQRDRATGTPHVTDERAAVYAQLRAEYGGRTVVGPDGRHFEISLDGYTAMVIKDGKVVGAIAGSVMLKFMDDIESGVLKELNDGGLV